MWGAVRDEMWGVTQTRLEPRHLGEDVEDVHLLVHGDDAELDEEPDDEVAHLQQRALERRVRALAVLPLSLIHI